MKIRSALHFFISTFPFLLLIPLNVNGQFPGVPREYWQLPTACVSAHDVGKLTLGVSNKGYFANSTSPIFYNCRNEVFYFSGSEYPRNSLINYLRFGSIWIGGVRRGDTLVTEGVTTPPQWFEDAQFHNHPPYSEMNPDEFLGGEITQRSSLKGSEFFDINAISQQDLSAKYTDTIVQLQNPDDGHEGIFDFLDFRLHQPLFIEVTQNSFAWSHEYAEDIVLFEISIRNIGEKMISGFSFGINMESRAGYKNLFRAFTGDDLLGFLKSFSLDDGCGFVDTLNLVWLADRDGDPYNGGFTSQLVKDTAGEDYKSVTGAIGALFLSVPDDQPIYFNWWNRGQGNDFGPMRRGNFRDFRTGGTGSPEGDRNKYFVMRNQEVDYDPAYVKKIEQSNLTWIYPDQDYVLNWPTGPRSLSSMLSFRGESLTGGSSTRLVFAVLMGENFHTDPNNLQNLPDNPDRYYANLDFSDLAHNAQIAKWIYDNPGVDTDKDGYRGEFRVCVLDSVLDVDSNGSTGLTTSWTVTVAETTWYKGDGVPDWKPALPPPTPKMWVKPVFNGINIRFNGQESENSKDIFTQMNDFEGYHIYLSRDEREPSYSLIATYDIENYDKYIWNYDKQPDPGWDLLDFPMTPDEVRCNYAASCDDSLFDPLNYRPGRPYQHRSYPDSLFYWEKHQWNVSEFGVTSDIKRIYPNARDPRGVPADSLIPDDYTDDGYLKYFDYEITIEDILPTVPYFVSVTAFDFGWPKSRLDPQETPITENAQEVFA
ncbi:MAG: hypothetical protein ACREBV_04525, partial [Candidatus Zixiibacteriota bacterium]